MPLSLYHVRMIVKSLRMSLYIPHSAYSLSKPSSFSSLPSNCRHLSTLFLPRLFTPNPLFFNLSVSFHSVLKNAISSTLPISLCRYIYSYSQHSLLLSVASLQYVLYPCTPSSPLSAYSPFSYLSILLLFIYL
jgi:hypothetical protein